MDDNYLNDRETLAQFVDALLQQKPGELRTPAEQKQYRSWLMHQLDDQLTQNIFASLPDDLLRKADKMLDDPATTADDYDQLFEKAGIDIEKSFTETATQFAQDYLSGQLSGGQDGE